MSFREDFITYLWQFQQFEAAKLKTADGSLVKVIRTGFVNTDAGPDFMNARLVIEGIEWAGNVEIHVKSSDWYRHNHETDKAYDNVVLHVVWDNDQPIQQKDGTTLPTVALKGITSPTVVQKFKNLIQNNHQIPCQESFKTVDNFHKVRAFEKALVQRVEQKASLVLQKLESKNKDWEQTVFELMARNFGFKINAEPFEQLASNLPLKILQKHQDSLFALEAILFGMSGLLTNEIEDDYTKKLKQEYAFYAAKFDLSTTQMHRHEWKFLRLRPANFPTIRMAQLAKLIHTQRSFFSLFTTAENYQQVIKSLHIGQSNYWLEHYDFGKKSATAMHGLGKASGENIVVNTVIPLLFAYGQYLNDQNLKDKGIKFLEQIKAEKNHITDFWTSQGIKIKTAFDAQGGIELYNNFCTKKQCLQCAVGLAILKT